MRALHNTHLPSVLLTAVPATSPRPNLMTLDEYTPHQYWSANFIYNNY